MSKVRAADRLASHFARALIVEHDRVLRGVLARVVSRWAQEVALAGSVREARAALRSPVDLVIADVRLPDGVGHWVFERALSIDPQPVLVAISGKASALEGYRLAEMGVGAFVPKPFSTRDLRRGVMEALGKSEAASAERPSLRTRVVAAEGDRFAKEHELTRRQAEIVRVTLCGVSREELAGALGVSENTCKTIVRRLLARCRQHRLQDIVRIVLARVVERNINRRFRARRSPRTGDKRAFGVRRRGRGTRA